ncbi:MULTISPECIES: SpoIIE family protein phosphatase [unclassified Streptomyces]|uniref:SpoIIE family protein phosphatase n=1 Tax=unclassified Streptomyces TaxID=2593676 RepID=UPI001319D12D|nr:MULTISPECIES: SpoIIE family protein phosphatase [unclassified Streptomyces]MYX37854.1 SpoIIE family protein phosphatase [Streptomyces sp. SID8377]
MLCATLPPQAGPADRPWSYDAAQQLVDSAVPTVADFAAVEVSDATVSEQAAISGLPATGLAFRRGAFRAARGAAIPRAYEVGEVSSLPARTPYHAPLTDLRPHLVLNLRPQTGWLTRDPVRAPLLRISGTHSLLVMPLDVGGVVLGIAAFYRTTGSPAFSRADLVLAGTLARKAARLLDGARRRLVQNAAGRILQEALLAPQGPRVSAIEDPRGHLPSSAAPGAWVDVIPLPSARVALVTGTVRGQGLSAATAMSQLKAAVRALVLLDMSPGEVISRLHRPAATPVGNEADRCLIVVYDPVACRCTVACGGCTAAAPAPPPGAADGDGPAPGEPEVTECDVPPGSVLVLSCGADGTHAGAQEAGQVTGLRVLPAADAAAADPATVLDGVLRTAAPGTDPVLLAARTRCLDSDDVATREVANDPAAVADARDWADRLLTEWKLPELAFTTTLVVSELVTNAIRYSTGPIRLRLIRDRVLVCEVSDSCSAAPHPRHASPSDQDGRGLAIVAQLTDAQGTRYTATGKTVWAEQLIIPPVAA